MYSLWLVPVAACVLTTAAHLQPQPTPVTFPRTGAGSTAPSRWHTAADLDSGFSSGRPVNFNTESRSPLCALMLFFFLSIRGLILVLHCVGTSCNALLNFSPPPLLNRWHVLPIRISPCCVAAFFIIFSYSSKFNKSRCYSSSVKSGCTLSVIKRDVVSCITLVHYFSYVALSPWVVLLRADESRRKSFNSMLLFTRAFLEARDVVEVITKGEKN